MKKFDTLALFLTAFYAQGLQAHSHTTYIVEQPIILETPRSNATLIVESEPPAEIEEVVGVSPGPNYYWIKGHWHWEGGRWIRVNGRWAARPHPTAVWVSGCWVKHGQHWRWTEGYWR